MKNLFIILNSTIIMVLFCFVDTYSLPLTRSCYTTSEDKIDMSLSEEFVYIENMNRKDNFSFDLGIPGDSSIGFDFSLIHYNFSGTGESRPGDIMFNAWHFAGDYFGGTVDSGLGIVIRIPTGPDAYIDEKSRNLSFGNSELKIAPVLTFNLTDYENLILNLSYTFREERGGNLYGGLRINPLNIETYKSCFGLNPYYKDSFFEKENLKNDYASVAAGLISSRFSPWILFTEIYYSSKVYRGEEASGGINIEGDRVSPLLLSAGFKYFFSGSFFVQVSDVQSLLKYEKYIKNTMEFSLNIFF